MVKMSQPVFQILHLAIGWVCAILVEDNYMNRFVPGFDFLGHKIKPLEGVKVRNLFFAIYNLKNYTHQNPHNRLC